MGILNNKNGRLVAGPWVGEFGWELMMWQGHLRKMAENFEEIIVSGRTGHNYLYQDFCTKYIPFNINGETEAELCNGRIDSWFLSTFLQSGDIFIPAQKMGRIWPLIQVSKGKQKFIKYGTQREELKYDLVIHERQTDKCDSGYRNWPIEKWNTLVERLSDKNLKIASIGKADSSEHIQGTDDKTNIPVRELADLFASSRLLVGTSSGPMHYGSLCGIKKVVITPSWDFLRYKYFWNPFRTPVEIVYKEGWNPGVNRVYDSVMKSLDKENGR